MIALFLSTPVTLLVYYINAVHNPEVASFFFLNITEYNGIDLLSNPNDYPWQIVGFTAGCFLWCVIALALVIGLCGANKKILAGDADMFFSPSYDGLFFEQHLLLNMIKNKTSDPDTNPVQPKKKFKVFICSTMYKESKQEMKELLTSLKKFAESYAKRKDPNVSFESHIILDNGVKSTGHSTDRFMEKFAIQLFELLKSVCELTQENVTSSVMTSYGWYLRWNSISGDENGIPISIHLKDPQKVKSKKR